MAQYSEKLSFQERNRYSFSGTDVAAFAFYPHMAFSDEKDRDQLRWLNEKLERIRQEQAWVSDGGAKGEDGSRAKRDGKSINTHYETLHSGDLAKIQEVEKEIQRLAKKIRDSLPVHLESLATISLSIHEPKSPVRALGHKAPKGFARSVRTIAGTMVLLVIEDHPLRKLAYQVEKSKFGGNDASWSLDNDSMGQGTYRNPGTQLSLGGRARLSTLLKPFNITLTYRTEVLTTREARFVAADRDALADNFEDGHPVGSLNNLGVAAEIADEIGVHEGYSAGALDRARADIKGAKNQRRAARKARRDFRKDPYSAVESVNFSVPKVTTLMIEGVEIISEGITTSVNDMVTEVVIQFQAQDVKQMSSIHESSELSFEPEDLPSDIYAELRGQAMESTQGARKDVLKDMKKHSKKLKQELRQGRRDRKKLRGADELEQYSPWESDEAGLGSPGWSYEPE